MRRTGEEARTSSWPRGFRNACDCPFRHPSAREPRFDSAAASADPHVPELAEQPCCQQIRYQPIVKSAALRLCSVPTAL